MFTPMGLKAIRQEQPKPEIEGFVLIMYNSHAQQQHQDSSWANILKNLGSFLGAYVGQVNGLSCLNKLLKALI
jgi:hypothetical protein